MEVDALVLVVVVISVALTTFVFTILGKYCYEKWFNADNHSIRRIQRRRSSGCRSTSCRSRSNRRNYYHCHHCPGQVTNLSSQGKKPVNSHRNHQVAINVGQATDDLKLRTFAQLAPPAASAVSDNPSETFARLGIRSSKDGKAFDLDRQLQIANTSSSEIDLNDPSAVEAINGILGQKWQLRQMNMLQQDASYRHYEEVVSAVVRNPGDGQQTEDDNDLIVLPANEANMKKNPKSIQDQVKAGSSGITPFKGVTLSIYDEVPKPTSVNVGKPSVDNALSDIPEATRSCNSSMPATSTATIASETGTVNSNTYIKAEESLYEQPIEIYDLKKIELNLGGGNSSNGTVQEVDDKHGSDDVFPLNHADLKRFSYPRPSNHCPTCSCQHYVVTNALLLNREKKKTSEEIFEEQSAKKKTPLLTDSFFNIKTSTSVPDEAGERKLLAIQFNDNQCQNVE